MKHTTATIDVMLPNSTTEPVDLDGMNTLADLVGHIRELAEDPSEEEEESLPIGVSIHNPDGFAVHLFKQSAFTGLWTPVSNFDDILTVWSNETDEDRREAMGEYMDDMGTDDLSDFDEAYQGQYSDGADFAQQICEDLGTVPKDFPTWIAIDWEQTWNGGLRFDYVITDSGHVFRNL